MRASASPLRWTTRINGIRDVSMSGSFHQLIVSYLKAGSAFHIPGEVMGLILPFLGPASF